MLWGKSESLHVRQKMSIIRRTSLLCSRAFVIEAKHARIRVAGVDWLKPIPFNDWTVGQPLSELHWIWKRIKFRSSVSLTVPLVSTSVKSGLQNLAKSLHVFSLLLSLIPKHTRKRGASQSRITWTSVKFWFPPDRAFGLSQCYSDPFRSYSGSSVIERGLARYTLWELIFPGLGGHHMRYPREVSKIWNFSY